MSSKKFAGSKPQSREKPADDERLPVSQKDEPEAEHIEDDGEPLGANFA